MNGITRVVTQYRPKEEERKEWGRKYIWRNNDPKSHKLGKWHEFQYSISQ